MLPDPDDSLAKDGLARAGIAYRRRQVPQTGQHQLFFTDPAGNGVELIFASTT
jgi:hypothetical protein